MVRKRDIKEIDAIVRELGLSREQRQLLHDEIHGQGLTHQEIRRRAEGILQDYPGKRDRTE